MIFSEIQFLPQNVEQRRIASNCRLNPYSQHQALWKLWQAPSGSPREFLFRADHDSADQALRFWALSAKPPHASDGAWRIRSKPFAPVFDAGDELAFELRVNATIAVRRPGTRGLRVDPIAHWLRSNPSDDVASARAKLVYESIPEWLAARASKLGFELLGAQAPCAVQRYEVWRFMKSAGKREVTLGVSDLNGRLRVTDADLFLDTVRLGIGHGKGFGLGMLMLRRASAG